MLLFNFRWKAERCTVNSTTDSPTTHVNSSHNVSMETRSLWLTLPSLFCSVCVCVCVLQMMAAAPQFRMNTMAQTTRR